MTATRLPAIEGTDLAGRDRTIPDDLSGPTLVLLAYRQRQQRAVDTWIEALPPGIDRLEIPVLGRRWLPLRSWAEGGMASNMDRATQERTMCLFTDVSGFRERLGIARDETRVAALLLDRDGAIVWHAFGPADRGGRDALRAAASLV